MQYGPSPTLPEPDHLSAQHSARVAAHIRAQIDAAGGYIGFASFMHEALYAPGLGYYAAGATKFGAAGDFITAPEISSVFGRVLARQCAEVLAGLDNAGILEVGAGSGKLALDMLQKFAQLDALPSAYTILEVSPDLAERQKFLLQTSAPHLAERVRWISQLPEKFSGVVVANEVLDAIPVEQFVIRGEDVMQIGVAYDDKGFVWQERRANERLRASVAEVQNDIAFRLPDGYRSEAALAAARWVSDMAWRMQEGVMLLFDYGVTRREYYAPDRSGGWLRCHFRHHVHDQALILPGIQDLSAWVDFSSVASAAVGSGMTVLGFQTQSQFLLGGGLESEMQGFDALPAAAQLKLSSEIKSLTLPGEMGENFKCIALGRDAMRAPSAFQFADRTQSL